MFAPKGLNKSAQGQSRASRDVTLGMKAHKPILPCKGYIKSAILMSVRRSRHSRGNLFYVTFRPRNSKSPRRIHSDNIVLSPALGTRLPEDPKISGGKRDHFSSALIINLPDRGGPAFRLNAPCTGYKPLSWRHRGRGKPSLFLVFTYSQ